jgi:hypothetical protein
VAVDRSDVRDAELLEHVPLHDRVPQDLAHLLEGVLDAVADQRDRLQQAVDLRCARWATRDERMRARVARQRPDRLRDRPFVVVEHDQHARAECAGVVGAPRTRRRRPATRRRSR